MFRYSFFCYFCVVQKEEAGRLGVVLPLAEKKQAQYKVLV